MDSVPPAWQQEPSVRRFPDSTGLVQRYLVSFAASRVEEIVKSDDIRMIQQPHHLQLTILHSINQQELKQSERLQDRSMQSINRKSSALRNNTSRLV